MSNKTESDFVIYGRQPVYEALRSDQHIRKVIIAREIEKGGIRKLLRLVEKRNLKPEYVPKANLQKFSGPVLHQGIIALAHPYKCVSEKNILKLINEIENPLILILDQIQDPHNLGAIIRTAEIAGVSAIVLPVKGSGAINSTVAKTSAGAIFYCKIHYTDDLPVLMTQLQALNISLYAMVQQHENTIYNMDLKTSLGIVVGSEGKGVRKNIQKLCDGVITIPGFGQLDSLNASVSTAIVLFEALRQRRFNGQ